MKPSDSPAAAGGPAPGQVAHQAADPGKTWIEKVKTIGGLVAVSIGVLVVGVIAIVALIKDSSTAATIASSAGGVIATIVGAYFGVKVGTDQSKSALEGLHAEAAKAQVYAAHLPAGEAPDIVSRAEKAANDVLHR